MKEKSILKKVEKETSRTERIAGAIPGFKGYKQKELRREADRLIRDNIYRKLADAKSNLREIFQRLAINKVTGPMGELDRVVAKFDRVAELINHAPSGYSGFYNAVKIEEDDLERMIDFDLKMVESAKEIETKVKQFKKDALGDNFESASDKIGELRVMIEDLESSFNERKEVIMGVEI